MEFLCTVGILGFGLLALIIVMLQYMVNQDEIKAKIKQFVKDAEGTHVHIKRIATHTKGTYHYSISYIDRLGSPQKIDVAQRVDSLGRSNGDILWSKPLNASLAQASIGGSNSPKEQIISEMDAEIQRLRGALAVASTDGLSKRVQGDTK